MSLAYEIRTYGTIKETFKIGVGNIERQEIIEFDGIRFLLAINYNDEVEFITTAQ